MPDAAALGTPVNRSGSPKHGNYYHDAIDACLVVPCEPGRWFSATPAGVEFYRETFAGLLLAVERGELSNWGGADAVIRAMGLTDEV